MKRRQRPELRTKICEEADFVAGHVAKSVGSAVSPECEVRKDRSQRAKPAVPRSQKPLAPKHPIEPLDGSLCAHLRRLNSGQPAALIWIKSWRGGDLDFRRATGRAAAVKRSIVRGGASLREED